MVRKAKSEKEIDMRPLRRIGVVALVAALVCLGAVRMTQGQLKKSDAYVKITAEPGPVDSAGKQVITLKVVIDKGWHIYANPVGLADLEGGQTRVEVKGAKVLKADYPAGKLNKDKIVGDHNIYEDSVVIKVEVERGKDATPHRAGCACLRLQRKALLAGGYRQAAGEVIPVECRRSFGAFRQG